MDNPTFVVNEATDEKLSCRSAQPVKSLSSGGEKNEHAADASLKAPRLRRTVGPVSAVTIVMGTMIGAGIFVSSGGVLARAGSVTLALLVWASCGLLCTLASLCYIELGYVVPRSGGEFAYFLHAFGPLHNFFGPLPAFLYAWMTCLVTRPANVAIQSLAVAEYCIQPWFSAGCRPHPLAVPLTALCVNSLAAFVNSYSVTLTTALHNFFTAAKLAVLAAVLVGGAYFLSTGGTRHLAAGFRGSNASIGDLAAAFYAGLWAYDGWNNLNFLTEELVAPGRDLPRALALGVPLVTAIYLLVNVAYLTALSPEQLVAAPAVAVAFAERALGALGGVLVPLGVALSVYGALNGTVLTTSRIIFTAARAGHLWPVLGLLQARRLTPAPAVIFNAVLAAAMIAAGDISTLIHFSSFTVWIFYGLAMAALLVMRRTRPQAPRPFRAPTVVAWLVLAAACLLVVGPLVQRPQPLHLCVLAFLLVGVFVYWQCVYLRRTPPAARHFTRLLQQLLQLVSSQE